jgi:hypothetical protein
MVKFGHANTFNLRIGQAIKQQLLFGSLQHAFGIFQNHQAW